MPTKSQIQLSINHLQSMTGKRYQCIQMVNNDTFILMQQAGQASQLTTLNNDIPGGSNELSNQSDEEKTEEKTEDKTAKAPAFSQETERSSH